LEDGCIAGPGSRAQLEGPGFTVELPPKWRYAQGSLIFAVADGSVLAVTAQPQEANKADRVRRDDALAVLIREMKIELPKKKLVWPKKPDHIVDAGDYQVALYQFESVAREARKGTLLIFSINPPNDDGLLGGGFVPDDDDSNADRAIMRAIRSIGKTAAGSAPSGSGIK